MNSIKNFILPIILMIFALSNNSIIAQSSIVSLGGSFSCNNGSISLSVGQVAFNQPSNDSMKVSEGVQQPFEILTNRIFILQRIEIQAYVYPNPANISFSLFILNFENTSKKIEASIYDNNGHLISNYSIEDNHSIISVEDFSASTYYLILTSEKQFLKVVKIIKI